MSLFRKRKVSITEKDPTYKVRYLGNVQTTMMKGEGCVDKPTGVLWNNYTKTTNAGIDMKLTLCASGMKAITKEQGLTEYRAHRISYCIAHPKYPKMFVWVYRHEGKKMKVELRCHAVLCKSESKAKVMAIQLHEKLTEALNDFKREKTRRQNTRLLLQRTNSLPGRPGGTVDALVSEMTPSQPVRTKFLSQGQNFKPSINHSTSAPKLGCISEDKEEEVSGCILEEDEEEEEVDEDYLLDAESLTRLPDGGVSTRADRTSVGHETPGRVPNGLDDISNQLVEFQLGNDIEELRRDTRVRHILNHQGQRDTTHSDSEEEDDDSSESSGFSEQQDQHQRDHQQHQHLSHHVTAHGPHPHHQPHTTSINGDSPTINNNHLSVDSGGGDGGAFDGKKLKSLPAVDVALL